MRISTPNAQVADKLNNILAYLHDSYHGYLECADKINNAHLRVLLISAANERKEMINNIEGKIKNLDASIPTDHGTIAGPAHRLYIDLKALFTSGDEDAIINEIKRGENTLINTYKETLRVPLPSDLNFLLKDELRQIQSTIQELDQASV